MFETDRLPDGWADRLNKVDEVWVPTHWHAEQFIRSGFEPDRVAVIGEAVDGSLFAQDRSLVARAGRPFTFLSTFKWEHRKGWDVLFVSFRLACRCPEGVP